MNRLSSALQQWRFRSGLFWASKYPPIPLRFFFRAVMAFAVIVMVTTHQDLADRAEVMEKVLHVYEPRIQVIEACEAGKAIGYHYPSGKAFECQKQL